MHCVCKSVCARACVCVKHTNVTVGQGTLPASSTIEKGSDTTRVRPMMHLQENKAIHP